MRDAQWTTFARPDGHHRERQALEFLKDELPSYPPFRAWANFRFLPLEGGFFDIDLLVCSPAGVFLVELEPHGGEQLRIGSRFWERLRQNGEVDVFDTPLEMAQYKADQLEEAIDHFIPGDTNGPPVEPLIFVSQPDVDADIEPDATDRVLFHPDADPDASILDALVDGDGPGVRGTREEVGARVPDRLDQALVDKIQVDAATKHTRIRDWELGDLLDAAPRYQDFRAEHRSRDETCRARVFRSPKNAGDDQLARLQEAARREFEILEGLDHPSILPARKHIGHVTRPAILFEHPEGTRRLDHYMRRGTPPSARDRFSLLSNIAEAVRYAHGHKVVHRALSPQSVLVQETDEDLSVRIFNWHTSRQADHETGTRHVSDYLDDASKFFLAPELRHAPDVDETADIFSLGALAFFLFTGEPPARSLSEFASRIGDDGGLRLSNFLETVDTKLDDLVFEATRVSVDRRISSAETFIERLGEARDNTLDDRSVGDPLAAQPGDILEGGWHVDRRIGSGSTATALLTESDAHGRTVLKIANDEAHEPRLEAEAEALEKFDDDLVIDLYDQLEIGGRLSLVLQPAGETLRQQLRDRSALSLDEQRRWGEDLCEILCALEDHAVFHRDIKPANLGVTRINSRGPYRLMLFDFSLSGVSVDATQVGTKAYRDPMLDARGQWDAHADRYAGAVVLYEMVTQQLPDWGATAPALDDSAEITLEPERFPASIRDDLEQFFRKAFARDYADRFDTAGEMLKAWKEVTDRTLHSTHDEEGFDLSEDLQPTQNLAELGISEAARDALDTLEATSVEQLLEVPSNDIRFLKGAGGEVRDELIALRRQLADIFPGLDVQSDHGDETDIRPGEYGDYSVDRVLKLLHDKPKNVDPPADDKGSFGDFIGTVLSDTRADGALPWPDVVGLAHRADMDAEAFEDFFHLLRNAWLHKKVLAALRDDIARIVDANGGAMTDFELARAVLADRGCLFSDRDRRLAAASAIARAAVETERAASDPRLHLLRQQEAAIEPLGNSAIEQTADGAEMLNGPIAQSPNRQTDQREGSDSPNGRATVFVAINPQLLDVLPDLGEVADLLATEAPLASSDRAYRALTDVLDGADLQPLPRHRLLALAAAASDNAAVSQRDELYPRDLDPVRAFTLTSNLLLRRAPLTADQIREAVRSRYPETAEIPTGPELEDLLHEADVALALDPGLQDGKGAYVPTHTVDDSSPDLTRKTGNSPTTSTRQPLTRAQRRDRLDDAREQLDRKRTDGGFLALTAKPALAADTASRLAADYDLTPVSLDRVFLDILRDATDQLGIDWDFFLGVDNPDRASSTDRNRLANLLRNGFGDVPAVKDQVTDHLRQTADRLLLTDPGLLGRWHDLAGTMDIVDTLRDRTRNTGPTHTWLLIPAGREHDRPKIAHTAVPVDKGDWLRVPRGLLDN